MSVRDSGYDPRKQHPRSGAHPASAPPPRARAIGRTGTGTFRSTLLLPAITVLALALVAVGFGSGLLGGAAGGPGASPGASGLGLAGAGSPGAASEPADSGTPDAPTGAASPAPGSSGPAPTAGGSTSAPAPGAPASLAIVPVTSFRTARTTVGAADVRAIAAGTSPFKALVLVARDADGILAALHVDRAAFGKRLVTVASAAKLAANLAANRTRLAFLRADEVRPSVRALAWGSKSLFGVDRVKRLSAWPLHATLAGAASGAAAYDPAASWTMVAGGDILLDRGISLAIQASQRGVAFPFDGGTVQITGRCRNCSPMGWDLPYTKRTGNAGAVRSLVHGASLAIANFENPAPNAFRFHAKGTVFSANPKYIKGLADAGIDWVSMANNHIGDAGRTGVVQTMANLDKYGIAHGGAGHNSTEAHKATLLKVGGVTVGMLGYDTIAPSYAAGTSTAGSARMTAKALKRDIAAARKAGADVVVVFPHWGIEYHAKPSAGQRDLGHAAIDAGADLVIGNHPHWAEGMEVYKGKPIWYALGNFVFDQTWSEYTMEGITLEMTFKGKQLLQVRIRPHLILGKAQPNFMDPAGSGKFVMDQVWGASKGLLAW